MVLRRIKMFLAVLGICVFTAMPMGAWAAGGTSLDMQESISANNVRKPKENARAAHDESDTGTVLVVNAAAGTGEKLSGAWFNVYENGRKMAEVEITDGEADLSLPEGDYYLRQQETPPGYRPEKASITFTVLRGKTTVVDITSEHDLEYVNPQDIIPKTGESIPIRIYACSMLCFMAAALCGHRLWHLEKTYGRGLLNG